MHKTRIEKSIYLKPMFKSLTIIKSQAIIHPWTMMVHLQDATRTT